MGSLKKHSFEKIWNGWRYRLFRWAIQTPFPPPECRSCFVCWGINGGNAGNVMAQEGLIIKGLYWMKSRVTRLFNRMAQLIARLPGLGSKPPEPNYHRGKPISAKRRPATESPSRMGSTD
jgi:hypothetical protein